MWHIEKNIIIDPELHTERNSELVMAAMVTTFTRTVEEWPSNLLVQIIVKGDIDEE